MTITRDEMETTCVYDYQAKEWTVYTCVQRHITKLLRMGEPYWKEEGTDKHGKPRIIAGKWKLGNSQVRFAKLIEKAEDDESEEEEETEEVEQTA